MTMTHVLLAVVMAAAGPGALSAAAQQPAGDVPVERAAPPTPDAPAAPQPSESSAPPPEPGAQGDGDTSQDVPSGDVERPRRFPRPVFRVGGNYRLPAGEESNDVMVITGNTTIAGRVWGDVVSVAGATRLRSTAVVHGSFIVLGGHADIEGGAEVRRDLVVIGAGLNAPGEFMAGGEHIVIEPAVLGGRLDALVPWITQGLLWGRLIVPGIPWIWSVVSLVFLAYLALNLVFDRPVRACADTLSQRPLSAFLAGLLVLLLSGPVLLLLTVSLVGIIAVPFVVCALLLAWIIGKVGVARWIGFHTVPEHPAASPRRMLGVRSFAIGFAVLCIAYTIPVLGLVAWTTVGVLGLGAAALAFMSGYRREVPAAPPRAVPPPPAAPPVPTAPAPAAAPVQPAAVAAPPEPPAPAYVPLEAPMPARLSEPAPAAEALHDHAAPAPAAPARSPGLLAFPRASFRDRLGAFLLDFILVLLGILLLGLDGDPPQRFLLLLLAYHIAFWTWKGTTVGGIICQLRVVRVNGEPLRFVDALVRGLSSILSLAVLGLGGLWILKDPERQSWHDKVAATYVVKVPRHYTL
jgi:uncharacterized RDD family membrane protein YckC